MEVIIETVEVRLASLKLQPSLLNRIKEAQVNNSKRKTLLTMVVSGRKTELNADTQTVIRYGLRLWVPDSNGLRKEVLREAYSSAYSIYP